MQTDDRGDIVASWLIKLSIVLGVLGILMFDVVSVGVGRVGVADDANNAAQSASEAYFASRQNVDRAYAAAVEYAEDHDSVVVPESFLVYPDGTVELKVTKSVQTFVFRHVPVLRDFTEMSETAKARSLPS